MTALPRPFVVAAGGQLASDTGGRDAWFAVTLWVSSETGSAAWSGALVLVTMLPGLLAGPPLAVLVDRFAPSRTMWQQRYLRHADRASAGGFTMFMVAI